MENDILARLREQQAGMLRKGEFAFVNRHDILQMLTIVDTLRAERDEARREVSFLRPSVCLGAQTAHEYADARGWDCFDQDNWPSTKDRSEPDAESQSPEA